ncbi:hypothetical protein D3C87_112010 [compost metagenome]
MCSDFSKPIMNSRGMISAEFIFSLVLAAGLCVVLFALTFTLSMAEVAQYIAFSSSRAHSAAHVDQDMQRKMGEDKFKELINNPVLKPLFNNADGGWFQLTNFEIRGGGQEGNFNDEYKIGSVANRMVYVGVRFDFVAKLLDMKIAFLGSTSDDPGGEGFKAKVTGFLLREPTQKECWDGQILGRYKAILALDSRYRTLGSRGEGVYARAPSEDNGC